MLENTNKWHGFKKYILYIKAFTIVIRFALLYDKLLVSDEMFVNIYLPLL